MKHFLLILRFKLRQLLKKRTKSVTGARCKVTIDGREVEFWNGEDIEFDFPKIDPINIPGNLEAQEIIPPEIKVTLLKGPK